MKKEIHKSVNCSIKIVFVYVLPKLLLFKMFSDRDCLFANLFDKIGGIVLRFY